MIIWLKNRSKVRYRTFQLSFPPLAISFRVRAAALPLPLPLSAGNRLPPFALALARSCASVRSSSESDSARPRRTGPRLAGGADERRPLHVVVETFTAPQNIHQDVTAAPADLGEQLATSHDVPGAMRLATLSLQPRPRLQRKPPRRPNWPHPWMLARRISCTTWPMQRKPPCFLANRTRMTTISCGGIAMVR